MMKEELEKVGFVRFSGIDKLVVKQGKLMIELMTPTKKSVIADLFVHTVESIPTLVEVAPSQAETNLTIPNDIILVHQRGLEEPEQLPFFERNGALPSTMLESGGNSIAFPVKPKA